MNEVQRRGVSCFFGFAVLALTVLDLDDPGIRNSTCKCNKISGIANLFTSDRTHGDGKCLRSRQRRIVR